MIEVISDREKDIQELCLKVLNMSPDFFDNPNGGYENRCPFCWKMVYSDIHGCSIQDIKHDKDCAYLIAKDLSTGYDNQ